MLHSLVDPGFPGVGRCRDALAAAYGSHGAAAMQTLGIRWGCCGDADDSGSVLLPAAAGPWPNGPEALAGIRPLAWCRTCLHVAVRARPGDAHTWSPAASQNPPFNRFSTRVSRRRMATSGLRTTCAVQALQIAVPHCPQRSVGNSVGIPGHLSAVAKGIKSLFPMDYRVQQAVVWRGFRVGCAHKSTEFSQLVHRVILCG